MPPDTRNVYYTESLHDAHTVRDLLAAAGVSAVLVRDPFEPGPSGGAGEVRIEVAAADEPSARRVIGRFEYSRRGPTAEHDAANPWPRCSECAAPRITRCPVCQTAGHDFPQADPDFAVLPEPGAAEEPLSCVRGGCAADQSGEATTLAGGIFDSSQDHAREREVPTMLTCTTCDEPFVPRYLKRCEWCGHTFPDGTEFERPDGPAEPLNARVVFVFFALATAALGLLAWLVYVL